MRTVGQRTLGWASVLGVAIVVLATPLASASQVYSLTYYHSVENSNPSGGFGANGDSLCYGEWYSCPAPTSTTNSTSTTGTLSFGFVIIDGTETLDWYENILGEHTSLVWGPPTGWYTISGYGYATIPADSIEADVSGCSGSGAATAWVNVYSIIEVTDVTANNDTTRVAQIAGSPQMTCSSSTQSWGPWPSSDLSSVGETNSPSQKVYVTHGDTIELKFQMGCEAYGQISTNVAGLSVEAQCGSYGSTETSEPTLEMAPTSVTI